MTENRNSLQPGYRLHWYVIKRILGQGGFGITYLAEDTNLNQEVAIKEYLPVELAVREQDASIHPVSGEYGEQFGWGLDRFMSEAKTLAQFKHPNIVRVLTVFPENNTAYMVMEYEHGQAMHELLREKKTLPQAELETIFLPVLDGLEKVHDAGFIHRDIKPPNIFIRADGTPVLLDFGSARQSLGERTRTLTSMVSPGFAPFEQYVSKSDKQGVWTDIYGLGATLYRSVTGRSPAKAMDRSEALLHTQRDCFVGASEIKPAGYSGAFLAAIDHALAFRAEDRPQSISAWREELMGRQQPAALSEAKTLEVEPAETQAGIISAATGAAEKITISTEKEAGEPAQDKPAPWYKKPLKVIAVVFGVLLLLAILDDNGKKQQQANTGTTAMDQEPDGLTRETPIDDLPATVEETAGLVDSPPLAVDKDVIAQEAPALGIRDMVSKADQRKLERITKELARNPENQRARQELRRLLARYETEVRQAFKDGKYDIAAAYIESMLAIAPDNGKLQELKKVIQDRREGR